MILDACLVKTEPANVKLKLSSLINPSIMRDTGSFKVSIFDAEENLLVHQIDSLEVKADQFQPGAIKAFNITFDNPAVS